MNLANALAVLLGALLVSVGVGLYDPRAGLVALGVLLFVAGAK